MSDRLRAPLFRSTGDPEVSVARVRCLSIARGLKEGIELVEELADRIDNGDLHAKATAWAAHQRDRFDIPRS